MQIEKQQKQRRKMNKKYRRNGYPSRNEIHLTYIQKKYPNDWERKVL